MIMQDKKRSFKLLIGNYTLILINQGVTYWRENDYA